MPDLSSADLSGLTLSGADFSRTDLRWAGLSESQCDSCIFRNADLMGANLRGARLVDADLREADLRWGHLFETDMRNADLKGSLLQGATMVKTDLRGADMSGARIFGVSVWAVLLDSNTRQSDLVITSLAEPTITTDNIEVAQFLYLLLNNQKLRDVIDAVTTKVVLILGRFTPERKALLDAIREALRDRNYLPVLYDFDKPQAQTTLEAISTLAHLARFVIADLTDAKSVLQELQHIVPSRPLLAIQPLLLASQEEPGMFDFLCRYPWVLPAAVYASPADLLAALDERVIQPAETKAVALR
jgi:uncharacterized protein YjbI with pentapeptide repeats